MRVGQPRRDRLRERVRLRVRVPPLDRHEHVEAGLPGGLEKRPQAQRLERVAHPERDLARRVEPPPAVIGIQLAVAARRSRPGRIEERVDVEHDVVRVVKDAALDRRLRPRERGRRPPGAPPGHRRDPREPRVHLDAAQLREPQERRAVRAHHELDVPLALIRGVLFPFLHPGEAIAEIQSVARHFFPSKLHRRDVITNSRPTLMCPQRP